MQQKSEIVLITTKKQLTIMKLANQTIFDKYLNIQWIENDGYTVGKINHNKKTISPCHGYYSPHPMAKTLKSYADKINYIYIEPK